jgi:hypothetical protein
MSDFSKVVTDLTILLMIRSQGFTRDKCMIIMHEPLSMRDYGFERRVHALQVMEYLMKGLFRNFLYLYQIKRLLASS